VATYLVSHLRVPGLPEPQSLEYLETVEATFLPYGGRSPALAVSDLLPVAGSAADARRPDAAAEQS
jgi:hypothetical protein